MEGVNPFVRVNQQAYDPETLSIIPLGFQPEYIRLMKERQHRLGILALAIQHLQDCQERVAENDSEVRSFFYMMERGYHE